MSRLRSDAAIARPLPLVAALLLIAVVGGIALSMSRPAPITTPSDGPVVSRTSQFPSPAAPAIAATPLHITWNRQPLDGDGAGPGTMLAITAGGPGLVAVGHNTETGHHHNTPTSERHHAEAVVWRAIGDAVWSRIAGQPGFEHAVMKDVAWSRDVLAAVGYDDSEADGTRTTRVWTSRDGVTWKVLPDTTIPAETRLTRVLGTPSGFLASGIEVSANGIERGVIWRSDDGTVWTRATDPLTFDARLYAIFEIGDELVAIGEERGDYLRVNPPVLWTSDDGSRWESIPLADDAFGRDLNGLAVIMAGGPGYIAAGTVIDTLSPQDPTATLVWPPTDGAIWTSSELRTWARVEPARELFGGEENQAITAIVPIGGEFVAFGSAGATAGAWSSADGQRWERIELPDAAMATVDDALVMNGAVIAMGSADGVPAVWRGWAPDSANSPAAVEGVDYPMSIYTHCGLDRPRIDFDGSFWRPLGETSDGQGNPPAGYDNPYDAGTIRLLADGTGEYTSSQGVRLHLERLERAPSLEPCA